MSEDEARWTGYVGKGVDLSGCFILYEGALELGMDTIVDKKGRRMEWHAEAWPPDKVEVIVRRMKK